MSRSVPGLPAKEVERIRALELEQARQVLRGSLDALRDLFDDDVVVMPPNQPTVFGWPAFRAMLESLSNVSRYEVWIDRIDGSGDLAYARGRYSLALADDSADDSGRWLHVLRRGADGSWVVVEDIFSSDRPAG
jgi:ketosteroid isomerase-like protein